MIYIDTPQKLTDNLHYLENQPILGLDCETTGFSPLDCELRLIQVSTGKFTLVIDAFKIRKDFIAEQLKPYLESKEVVKILHNAKFDLKFIKHKLKIDVERIFDSYLASLIIEGGISMPKGYHGLDQVAQRYLGLDVDKTEQKSDWSKELSESQLEYAAKDVEVLFPLREKLIEVLKEWGLIKCAKLEFEAVLPTAWLELCGFYLNIDQWIKLADENLIKAQEIAESIYEDLQPVIPQTNLFGAGTINLNSPQQVQKYFRAFGVPMPDSTREYLLNPLVNSYPIVGKLINYKKTIKASGSFGEKYREFISPVTGRVHADFMQIRAETGRYGVARPNLNQIPSDQKHRNCFQAEEGNKLISNDFSQEELRILADFSGDKKFRKVFQMGEDFHKATAALIFDIPVENVSKDQRDLAKRMNFGLTYGIGAAKFSMTAGISEDAAKIIIDKYFGTFKTVKTWINYQKFQVVQRGYSRSASGRITKYNFDRADRQAVASAQRNAVNMPMQATGADVLKRSLRIFYDESKVHHNNIKLVNIVHDEINLEVKESLAEEMAEMLKVCMIKAGSEFIQDVEVKVDCSIMDKWQKG